MALTLNSFRCYLLVFDSYFLMATPVIAHDEQVNVNANLSVAALLVKTYLSSHSRLSSKVTVRSLV